MKDAKGHGSDARGGSSIQLLGPKKWIPRVPGSQSEHPSQLPSGAQGAKMILNTISDSQARAALAQGGAKSAPVPVHSGAAGRAEFGPFADAVAGFREKYGPPRDLKAEARGFARGKREINRLKRQGK